MDPWTRPRNQQSGSFCTFARTRAHDLSSSESNACRSSADAPDIRFNSLERRDNGLNPDTPFYATMPLSQIISGREMRCNGFRFRLSVLRAENTLVILLRRIHPRGNPKVRDGLCWAVGMDGIYLLRMSR